MSKIICTLEHASDLINGVKFSTLEGVEGKVSEEVSESVAALFLSIPGYVLYGADGEEGGDTNDGQSNEPVSPPAPAPAPKATETAAQRKARLKAEQEAAAAEEQRKQEEEAARLAKEEADRKAAEGADGEGNEGEGNGEGENNEVF